jgi:hypothetical protein
MADIDHNNLRMALSYTSEQVVQQSQNQTRHPNNIRKRKSYENTSQSQQRKSKIKLLEFLESSNTFLNSIGLAFHQIILTRRCGETSLQDLKENITFKKN